MMYSDAFWLLGRSSDTLFYSAPRFVTHIDDQAIRALTKYYSQVLPPSNTPAVAILDMCSSWVGVLFSQDTTLFLMSSSEVPYGLHLM